MLPVSRRNRAKTKANVVMAPISSTTESKGEEPAAYRPVMIKGVCHSKRDTGGGYESVLFQERKPSQPESTPDQLQLYNSIENHNGS